MKSSGFVDRSSIVLILIFLPIVLCAQEQVPDTVFKPQIGQAGKDVIWVPTPHELVDKMMELAEVTSEDFVIDLGSGDGRTVIAAAKLGARALGIEYNPDMVKISRKKAEEAGVSDKTKFIQADLFGYDLSEATVITLFLLPEINMKIRPQLLDLKPGTRIVSNTFTMGDWEPDYEVMTQDNWNSWYSALMWIVPAKVDGKWKFGQGELEIHQEFQMFYGTLKSDNKTSKINEGKVNGDLISLSVDGTLYTGKVTVNSISGTATKNSRKSDWIAARIEN